MQDVRLLHRLRCGIASLHKDVAAIRAIAAGRSECQGDAPICERVDPFERNQFAEGKVFISVVRRRHHEDLSTRDTKGRGTCAVVEASGLSASWSVSVSHRLRADRDAPT